MIDLDNVPFALPPFEYTLINQVPPQNSEAFPAHGALQVATVILRAPAAIALPQKLCERSATPRCEMVSKSTATEHAQRSEQSNMPPCLVVERHRGGGRKNRPVNRQTVGTADSRRENTDVPLDGIFGPKIRVIRAEVLASCGGHVFFTQKGWTINRPRVTGSLTHVSKTPDESRSLIGKDPRSGRLFCVWVDV